MNNRPGNTSNRIGAPTRPDVPRKVRNGLKLKAEEPVLRQHPLAGRWLARLEADAGVDRLLQGQEYARLGQVISLEFESGGVRAAVQGRAARPHMTALGLPPWSAAQWEQLIDALTGEAIHSARLLAGELPPEMHEVCARLGLALVPEKGEALSCRCDCAAGAAGAMCKHAVAAGFLLAERLMTEPLLVFLLRGMTAQRVIERLRTARMVQARGTAAAHGDPIPGALDAPAIPLVQCIESYWRCGSELKALEEAPPSQHVSHALLRRLGPSPLGGKFPLVGLLASVYDTVSAAAVRMRDRAERIDENSEAPPSDAATAAPSP